jgi:hypothetical protein
MQILLASLASHLVKMSRYIRTHRRTSKLLPRNVVNWLVEPQRLSVSGELGRYAISEDSYREIICWWSLLSNKSILNLLVDDIVKLFSKSIAPRYSRLKPNIHRNNQVCDRHLPSIVDREEA